MKKKIFLVIAFLIGAIVFSIGHQYLEQKRLNETVKEAVRLATSSAEQETVLGTIKSVEVCSKDTVEMPRHYKSFAEAFNAYSELGNTDEVRIVVRYCLDDGQDPIAFMKEFKKHCDEPEWIDKYCKENNVSVEYAIVPND